MSRFSIPWRPLLALACLGLAICVQAGTGSGRIKITWTSESECSLRDQAQTITIDLFRDNRLVTSICAQRPIDSAVSTEKITDIDTGRYIFKATATGPTCDCGINGGVIGHAWGYFTVQGNRIRTINLTVVQDEDMCLRIEPGKPIIYPGYNNTRRLYAFAQNPDGATVLLPPEFVWSSANTHQAIVDPVSGVVTGWTQDGNVRVTVVNTATKLRANTLVLVRDWQDTF